MRKISNREVLIWLNSLNIGNRNIEKIMKEVPQLIDIWNSSSNINKLRTIRPKIKERMISNCNSDYIEKVFASITKTDINIITIFDENYPERLKYIYDSPKVLYTRGELLEEDEFSIAIVGSRKATSYGQWATERFVRELVDLDITIVSGLALGIDGVAHRTALEENSRTIAVLGNSLDTVYPKRHKDIYREIPKNGALVTEYFLGTPPLAYNFPQRNRIISGLSLGIIVIEAKEKSGSLITANHALEQGKEVFSLPGNINSIFSKGTNKLIKDGAKLVTGIDDIIEEVYELQEKLKIRKSKKTDYSQLSSLELKVFELIEEGPVHCDSIAFTTGLDISTVYSVLTILELKGMIKEITGGTFTLD